MKIIIRDGWVEFVEYPSLGPCKGFRIDPGGTLLFHDRCNRRGSERGTDQIRVQLSDLIVPLIKSLDDPAKVLSEIIRALDPPYSAGD